MGKESLGNKYTCDLCGKVRVCDNGHIPVNWSSWVLNRLELSTKTLYFWSCGECIEPNIQEEAKANIFKKILAKFNLHKGKSND